MANAASWFMFLLGIAHIVFGVVRFTADKVGGTFTVTSLRAAD